MNNESLKGIKFMLNGALKVYKNVIQKNMHINDFITSTIASVLNFVNLFKNKKLTFIIFSLYSTWSNMRGS